MDTNNTQNKVYLLSNTIMNLEAEIEMVWLMIEQLKVYRLSMVGKNIIDWENNTKQTDSLLRKIKALEKTQKLLQNK